MAKKELNKSSSKKEQSLLVKGYLFSYNALQVLGWGYMLLQIIVHYLKGGTTATLWSEVNQTVVIFQNAALLEILHVAIGLVNSNLMITTMQVMSRVMVVCGLLVATPTAQVTYGLPVCLFAWAVTEVIRYSMYALALFNMVPYFLTWSRYTFFYVLYPVGVTGELLCYYAAQDYVRQTKLWTYEMPNRLNFTFSYHYTLLLIMLSYIPLFPQMYFHMIAQRKKIIGGASPKKKDMDTTDLSNGHGLDAQTVQQPV